MYYNYIAIGVSMPSLLIESTNSMIEVGRDHTEM